jgi:hypothetical protein
VTTASSSPALRVLSLGAGVQSTSLLLLAAEGRLPALDAAIFADTGWEPRAVYEHLDRIEREVARPAGIPILRVSSGNIRDDALDPGTRFASMPLHILNADGGKGMSRRKRKVELGSCARPYGTPCQHEHACIRCPMLNINPKMIGRLNELEADLLARRERAHAEGWSGEIEGIDLTLSLLRAKRDATARLVRKSVVDLGIPTPRSSPPQKDTQ